MMITGDKLETAENIGYLAKFIKEEYKVVTFSANVVDLRSRCEDLLKDLDRDNDIALIVEGKQITNMVNEKDPEYIKIYK